jgi:hypothetical protein
MSLLRSCDKQTFVVYKYFVPTALSEIVVEPPVEIT